MVRRGLAAKDVAILDELINVCGQLIATGQEFADLAPDATAISDAMKKSTAVTQSAVNLWNAETKKPRPVPGGGKC